MEIDSLQVEVKLVQIESTPVVLFIEDINGEDDMILSLFMSREEAAQLGGLLIGHATAVGVPLVEKSEPLERCPYHEDGVIIDGKCRRS